MTPVTVSGIDLFVTASSLGESRVIHILATVSKKGDLPLLQSAALYHGVKSFPRQSVFRALRTIDQTSGFLLAYAVRLGDGEHLKIQLLGIPLFFFCIVIVLVNCDQIIVI